MPVRKTTEQFIKEAVNIWKDEFDYSEVDYKNAREKVLIKHNKCGKSFLMIPNNHIHKTHPHGCPYCRNEKIKSTMIEKYSKEKPIKDKQNSFIEKAKFIWGDEFDYSNVNYINTATKVTIKHNKCGRTFEITPNNHTNKTHPRGCPYCSHGHIKPSVEEVKTKIHSLIGDKYDLSLIQEYFNRYEKLPIVCNKHGVFHRSMSSIINGYGCPECIKEESLLKSRRTFDALLKQAKEIHGDKFIYDESSYVNAKSKMKIICKECGTTFYQTPHKHINGKHGCPNCNKHNGAIALTTEEVIKRVNDKFNDKYDTSKLEYVNANTKFTLICPSHGDFKATLRQINRKDYKGCPKCQQSLLEKEIEGALTTNDIKFKYIARKRDGIDWLERYTLDFYLPDYNIAIECQGEQHYEPIKRFGGIEKHKLVAENDKKKKQLCEEHGIKLLYYTHYGKIDEGENIYKDSDKLIDSIKHEFKSI